MADFQINHQFRKCIASNGIPTEIVENIIGDAEAVDFDMVRFQERKNKFHENQILKARDKKLQAVKENILKRHIDEFEGSEQEALISLVGKTVDPVKQKTVSMEARKMGVRGEAFSRVSAIVKEYAPKLQELLPFVSKNTKGQRQLVKALFGQTEGIDPNIVKMAKEVSEVFESLRTRFNDAGGRIKSLDEWGLPQAHDNTKILVAGEDRWMADFKKLVDLEKSGIESDAQISKIYETLTGMPDPNAVAEGTKSYPTFVERFGRQRKIHFKDPQSWLKYQKDYGSQDFFGTVIAHIDEMSDAIARVETFGPDPDKGFQIAKKHAQDKYVTKLIEEGNAKGNGARRKAAQKAQNIITTPAENMYERFTGKVAPGNVQWARRSATLRAATVMSLSGKILLSQLSDLPIGFWRDLYNGMGANRATRSTFRHIKNIFRRMDQEQAHRLGMITDSMLGYHSRVEGMYSEEDLMPGWVRKGSEAMFRGSGVTRWTEAGQVAHTIEMSYSLGDASSKSWDSLGRKRQRALGRYGINEGDWEVLKSSMSKDKGGKYLDPNQISDRELRTKVTAMYASEARQAIPEPGLRESTPLKTAPAGTWTGEAMRALGVFKAFPMTYLNTFIRPMWSKKAARDWGTAGLMMLFVLPAFGYVSYGAKQIASGQKPMDPMEDFETFRKSWMAGFLQAGGVGILGDLLFADENRFGGGAIDSLAGPVLAKITGTKRYISDWMGAATGDDKDLSRALSKTAMGLRGYVLPWTTWWFLKTAMDRWIFDPLQGLIDPKAKINAEKRQRKKERQGINNGLWWDYGDVLPEEHPFE